MLRYFVFLAVMFLSACVTETTSSFKPKENQGEALSLYIQLGLAYIQKQDTDRARMHLTRALEIDPDSAGAHAGFGLLYQREGEPALAEKSFQHSLRSDPGYTRGRTYYAAFLYSKKEYAKALDQLTVASQDTEYDGRAQVFVNIARCAVRLKDNDRALKAFEKATLLDRSLVGTIVDLIEVQLDMQEYDEAQRLYARMQNYIKHGAMTHSPRSLLAGARLAMHYKKPDQVASLGLVLKNLYPNSPEYKQYKALMTNE
ncbi:MAG: type IV pilus biogenesis/stability protein PilW [Hahellaceae bacterium]|nr:type IV pilus biogenesis/stability protein PilW [Hahellaceae bacterium]